ncbi:MULTISPECIES: histidinol dehydrogenase [unclassified Nonomuraea]
MAAIIEWRLAGEMERRRLLARGGTAAPDPELVKSVTDLVQRVRLRGDEALAEALDRFHCVKAGLRVGAAELEAAGGELDDTLKEAVRMSIAQVRAFNETALARSHWRVERDGVTVGELVRPIESAGLYVPCGKGSFPSVLIMLATPALVAGVGRIALVVPPCVDGRVDPAVLFAAHELGLTEVYRSNGPAGIAALACGTATIPAVRKLVGPGSPAVSVAMAAAQRLGCVVETGFGPTDLMIVCDGSADPRLLAADLLNEAEYGFDSAAVLVGTDRQVLERAAAELAAQIDELPGPRRDYAEKSVRGNGGIVLVGSAEEAMAVANAYAPEHLQLAVAEPEAWLPLVRHAGAVLLGQWTTPAASNFAIGTPATLPTTGFAKVASGVSVHTYLTRIPVAQLDKDAFWRLAPTIIALAEHEDFPAHAATVTVRQN